MFTGENKTPLIVALIAVIVISIGIVLFTVVPRTPPSDRVTASERERQREASMTPEERRQQEQREEEENQRSRSGTEQEGSR